MKSILFHAKHLISALGHYRSFHDALYRTVLLATRNTKGHHSTDPKQVEEGQDSH